MSAESATQKHLRGLAGHAEKLKALTQEARQNPDRIEHVLSEVDHVASVIADIAAIAT